MRSAKGANTPSDAEKGGRGPLRNALDSAAVLRGRVNKPEHVAKDVLVRLLDGELTAEDAAAAQEHLDHCAVCRTQYIELDEVSREFEKFSASLPSPSGGTERNALMLLLSTEAQFSRSRPEKALRGFAWGMAIAASLALGLLIAPHFPQSASKAVTPAGERDTASLLEVDGETFVPLPYSNPDLPVPTHHIVQMEVPVSSLADAGVHFESISSEATASDESVLADVLLGIDGQPLGVHVLSTQYQ
jgi:hypothetical protein